MTEEKPGRVQLSLTQLLGGAVAAMVGSLVASRLGVAGTIVGAAVISVVATVLTALNINSMNHVRDRTREARRSLAEARLAEVQRLRASEAGAPASTDVDADRTDEALSEAEAADLAELAAIDAEEAHDPAVEHGAFAVADRRGYHWGIIASVSALVFVLAMVGITVVEKITGQSIACSLGADCDRPTTIPLPGRSPTPTPTPTTSVSASPTPSVTVTVTPSATASPSPTPSGSSSEPTFPSPTVTQTTIPESPQPEDSP